MKRRSRGPWDFEGGVTTDQQKAVDRIKKEISPTTPCVHADADGRCSTGNCQGSICCQCADYKPVTADAPDANLPVLADKVNALTLRVDPLAIPDGSPAEQANALHRAFLKSAVSAKVYAVLCGWVLSLQRERLGHGQWQGWIDENLDFTDRTVRNYINAYDNTVGVYRAQQRRPLPLSEAPTMEEIAAATAGTNEKPLAALYRSTGVVEGDPNHGGAREGAGRKAVLPKLSPTQEAETLWAQAMVVFDKPSLKDAIRYLGEKAASVCLDRVADLAEALKLQVRELKLKG